MERYEIARGTGGDGSASGGNGLLRSLMLTRGTATVVAGTSRVTTQPWSLAEGAEGSNAQITLRDGDEVSQLESMTKLTIKAGQAVAIQTAGGGGYGK